MTGYLSDHFTEMAGMQAEDLRKFFELVHLIEYDYGRHQDLLELNQCHNKHDPDEEPKNQTERA